MADNASVRFAAAYKKMHKAGQADPAWFDRARDVLKRADSGDTLLLHALADGLREAYEAGKAGRGLPPLKLVEPGSTKTEQETATAWRAEARPAPAPATRITRRPAPAPVPSTRTRIVRTAK